MEQSYEYPDCGRQQRLGFWLLPFNKAAAALVSCHPHNLERYSYDEDTRGMWIDFSNPEKQEYTVGCSDSVDIYLPQVWNSTGSSGISERHASFRAVTDSGPVLLCDESEYLSTEPFSHGSHSYTVNFRREGRERSVLVAQGINSLIAFGHGRFYQFELRWENDGLDEFRMEPPVLYALGPSRTKTKSYVLGEKVGGGTFGNVYRAMQVTTGSVMAVKKFNRLSGKRLNFASREITTLLKINSNESTRCDHIIHILGYTTGPDWAEIFLPLKSGTLKTLVSNILPPSSRFQLSNLVLHQMLLALHHLDQHNIIHRDLSPENILWDHHFPSETGSYHFTLADFGLSISTSSRASRVKAVAEVAEIAGTTPFMAPEMYYNNRQVSSKADIWSLFATVVWVRDKRFRKGCELVGPHLVHVWLNRIAGNKNGEGGYEAIKRMACFDPRRRPSAGEQLEQLEMEEAELEEMDLEMEEMGLGGEEGLGEYALEMPYHWHEEAYMTDAVGDYEWDGTDGAWVSEGYALPLEVIWDGEEWMPGHDGHYSLAKSTRDKADAAMAMWKDWYLAMNG